MQEQHIETKRGMVLIRPTREEDADAYRTLRLEALQRYPWAFGADYDGAAARPMDYWRERMRLGAGHPTGVTYVAAVAGDLIGMTMLERYDEPKLQHGANIYSVYVGAAWRGAGVADALINGCLDWGRANDVRIVRLGVATANTSAIRCYLRCGFSVYGVESESIFHDGVYYDELLMHCRLAS